MARRGEACSGSGVGEARNLKRPAYCLHRKPNPFLLSRRLNLSPSPPLPPLLLVLRRPSKLTVSNVRSMKMNDDDVLAVAISPDAKHIAVSLLDSTVKLFFICFESENQRDYMLCVFRRKLRCLFSRLGWVIKKRVRARVIVRRLRWRARAKESPETEVSSINLSSNSRRQIRVATFNVAMFSLAPVVQNMEETALLDHIDGNNIICPSPKGILKQSPLHSSAVKKPKVCINLPDNEISLAQSYSFLSMVENEKENRGSISMRSPVCLPSCWWDQESFNGYSSRRSIAELLGELDADILALQDVKAEEEKHMKPLSGLASALGMKYVFAESWAPEYGNAILSKWPIKKWRVQRIADADDFRNVLKVTIEVPRAGEVNVYCTQLDHLDENWRMKQIDAITRGDESPHILLGGLNSLDGSDYSIARWNHIVKYYEDSGKPTPRVEVMRFLKGKGYSDSKEFAGECEPVVIIAKGQNVQGTCKYGTRVDYILASPESPYEFVPGSYSVVSSKGTSDHHIVKVDLVITKDGTRGSFKHSRKKAKQKIIRIKANLMPERYM